MIWEMVKVESRKVWRHYLQVLLAIMLFCCFYTHPLTRHNLWLFVMAAVQGGLLAGLIFHDKGGSQPFMFTRPFSRRRLFLIRWFVGFGFQLLTLLGVFLILTSGLRCWIQLKMGSPYYPMVKWYELEVLWGMALCSLFFYQFFMFFYVRMILVSGYKEQTFYNRTLILVLICFCMSVFFMIPQFALTYWLGNVWLLSYMTSVIVMCLWASAHMFRHLEIES